MVGDAGLAHAQAVWDAGFAAIEQIEAIVNAEGIDCDWRRVPGVKHVPLAGGSGPIWARALGFIALVFAAINIFGGFLVTQRMLAMYQKKKK